MSALVMNAPPARKPVPGRPQPAPAPASFTMQPKQPPAQYGQHDRLHGRTRTNSSNAIPFNDNTTTPNNISPAYSMTQQQQQQQQQPPFPGQQTRRTLSNATSSTSSTNTNANATAGLQRVPTNSGYSTTSGVRRSTSSRSNSSASPTSYVALMRKQKGTVWCDRAQHEDPRILAAQRQAKMRAAAEVAGGHSYASIRTSTSSTGVVGGVRSKIRHHGAPKASAYNATVISGAGVPMRLSASEVDDGNDSDEDTGARHHARNGSGRSSLGSGRRGHSYQASSLNHGYSNGSTPPAHSPVDSMGELREEETPMPNQQEQESYFGGQEYEAGDEEKFGSVGGLPKPLGPTAEEKAQRQSTAEDLKRRGSVDDRTMTMSNVRLYVANPDLSD